MRFKFFCLLLVLLISTGLISQSYAQKKQILTPEERKAILEKDLSGVFRGFVWGLPPTVILENEKAAFMEEQNGTLIYFDYIRDIKSTIAYEFHENKLWRIRVFIEKKYLRQQDRIEDLLTIQEDLTKRYGKPVEEEFLWKKKTEQNYPESWGWAVYRGELLINILWQNKETNVYAYLGAPKPYDPKFHITYVDRKVQKERRSQEERQDLLLTP